MFHLAIDHHASIDTTTHPNREVALGELVKFLDKIDCDYRVSQATWEHSTYEVLHRADLTDTQCSAPAVVGHAVIQEICECADPFDDHDESGCNALKTINGRLTRCPCPPAHRPQTSEATLFDDHPPAATACGPHHDRRGPHPARTTAPARAGPQPRRRVRRRHHLAVPRTRRRRRRARNLASPNGSQPMGTRTPTHRRPHVAVRRTRPAHPRAPPRHRHLAAHHPMDQIIRGLVAEGRDPDPVLVLATAKHQPCSESSHPEQPPTPGRHHKLAVYLAAADTQTVAPTNADTYAREVLDEALRRAFRTNGIRMEQLGASGAERADLTQHFAAIRDEVADLWRRAEVAAKPGWFTP